MINDVFRTASRSWLENWLLDKKTRATENPKLDLSDIILSLISDATVRSCSSR